MIKTIYDIPEHVFKTSYQNATIGHVLTPPKLALEMIETLPSDFIKSGIKILDPACKNGSFLFQIAIKQLDGGFSIKEIESSLYTCDTLNASLNIAESGIKHIIRFPYQNSLIKINNLLYKHIKIELLYDGLIKTITKNKYISIRQFINELILDRKNNWLIVKFEENLIHFIKKYEGLSKTESKLFGEVFTPQALIEEMLDTLPTDVWSNKDLKWLDPAVGIGNFPAAVLNRLMEGLKDVIVDSDERRKHILEEMLYMGDISTKNLFLLYQLFDQNDEFKLNVFRGDFLSEKFDKHMKEVWGLDGFDLVVGNPPYQENVGPNKTQSLWDKFVKKSQSILNENGYLVMVHPSGWRSLEGIYKEIQNILKGNLLFLSMNDEKEGQRVFNATTNFDWYCYSKNKVDKTKVKDQNSKIVEMDLSNLEFIPNSEFELFDRLIAKEGEEKVSVLYNRSSYGTDKSHMSKEKSEKFKYPCVYTIIKNGTINKWWSNIKENGHFGIPKVIWSNGMASPPTLDIKGEYGLTQFAYAIVDEASNLEKIRDCMNSDRFINFMKLCYMANGNRFDRKVLSSFRKDFWKEFIN